MNDDGFVIIVDEGIQQSWDDGLLAGRFFTKGHHRAWWAADLVTPVRFRIHGEVRFRYDERVEIEGTGTLLDFTRVLRGVPGLNNSFAIGLIKLDAGPVLNAPLVDGKMSASEGRARGAGDRRGQARCKRQRVVGPKFRPA